MVKSEIDNLTFNPSFDHNLCFKYPNGSCEPILNISVPRTFQWHKELFNPMNLDPWIQESNSQNGSSLGNVKVPPHSYTPKSMKWTSRASLFAHTFAILCFGREPKTRVTTKEINMDVLSCFKWSMKLNKCCEGISFGGWLTTIQTSLVKCACHVITNTIKP
jgi:hypothetical protein